MKAHRLPRPPLSKSRAHAPRPSMRRSLRGPPGFESCGRQQGSTQSDTRARQCHDVFARPKLGQRARPIRDALHLCHGDDGDVCIHLLRLALRGQCDVQAREVQWSLLTYHSPNSMEHQLIFHDHLPHDGNSHDHQRIAAPAPLLAIHDDACGVFCVPANEKENTMIGVFPLGSSFVVVDDAKG